MPAAGVLPILNLSALNHARRDPSPFPWLDITGSFTTATAPAQLRHTLPDHGWQRFIRLDGQRRHNLIGLKLRQEQQPSPPLPEIWRALVDQLESPEYHEAISRLSRSDLSNLSQEITVWRQGAGGFIDPHPDNPDKVVVHLIYLSGPHWKTDWGGCLRLLRSPDLADCAAEIPPEDGRAVVFCPTTKSWHGYLPIQEGCPPRLALQIVFHRPGLRYGSHR